MILEVNGLYLAGIEAKLHPQANANFLKNAFLTGADCFFEGFPKKREIVRAIQDLPLSNSSVTKRINNVLKDLQTQLKSDLDKCELFAQQFDESKDTAETSQIANNGGYIYQIFLVYANTMDMPLHKLSAITTDGVPAKIGKVNGFITHCKKDKSFPNFNIPFYNSP
ncbi:hypothetical protein RF11_12283 [Thelohanellus kitauei]|uniref:Uncharacterized protein n=1 Tax=Thelohanellus kitauei TaxID=669202 RepID=A0A0C2JE53_THEKT|nr:hypothetical protein RF11_12283 [Thelohanellus kitauei]